MKIVVSFAVGLVLASALPTISAQAQNLRSFVSPTGSDAANCSLATPCRTFAAAYAATNANGEIAVLGTAGYGPLTINKAISIVNAGGFEAGIAAPAGNGISINVDIGAVVSLRGLTIDGQGSGNTGVQFDAGGALIIDNCVVRRMTTYGINFAPNNGNAPSRLSVSNSVVSNMANDGIRVMPNGSSGPVSAVLNGVQANNNGRYGIVVDGTTSTGPISTTVTDSIASGNFNVGFFAVTSSGTPATLTVFNSVAATNGAGLDALTSGAIIRVAHSLVTGNTSGWTTTAGGAVLSAGDNTIEGNSNSETAPPAYTKK